MILSVFALAVSVSCAGAPVQGGLMVCHTAPGATLTVQDQKSDFAASFPADNNGYASVGFSRNAGPDYVLKVCLADGTCAQKPLHIKKRAYKIETINGLPPSKVSSFTPAQLAHIRASSALKKAAFRDFKAGEDYLAGFAPPVKNARISGVYGSQRVLNGKPKRPHFGIDYAVPAGTPISAPAGGVVTLAQDDLYFEGGTVFLDHGNGLVSVFMHMSRVDVTAGTRVEKGAPLGRVGATGRATGPHLHWSVKWRNLYYIDPQSALGLDPADLR